MFRIRAVVNPPPPSVTRSGMQVLFFFLADAVLRRNWYTQNWANLSKRFFDRNFLTLLKSIIQSVYNFEIIVKFLFEFLYQYRLKLKLKFENFYKIVVVSTYYLRVIFTPKVYKNRQKYISLNF